MPISEGWLAANRFEMVTFFIRADIWHHRQLRLLFVK